MRRSDPLPPRAVAGVAAVVTGLLTPVARGQPCLEARPTEAGAVWSYEGAPARSFALEQGAVRVFWTEAAPHAPALASARADGVPSVVVRVAEVGDAARATYESLGFRSPRSDAVATSCAADGGDARVDVYLFDFAGADGRAALTDCTGGPCTGFLLLENDFAGGGYPDHDTGLRTVLPHEYFHLVQAAYGPVAAWWSEGTAQWAAKQVYPELTDLERFLPAFLDDLDRPLDAAPSGAAAPFLYGTALWPVFLEQRFAPALVREIFDRMAAASETETVAMDAVLADHGSSLADAFAEFALWNGATGSRATAGAGYAAAATYPEASLEALQPELPLEVHGATAGLSARYFRLAPNQPVRVSAELDSARSRIAALPIESGGARLERAVILPQVLSSETLLVVAGLTASKSDAPFVIRVEPARDTAVDPSSCACRAPALSRHSSGFGTLLIGSLLPLIRSLRREQGAPGVTAVLSVPRPPPG